METINSKEIKVDKDGEIELGSDMANLRMRNDYKFRLHPQRILLNFESVF